MQANEKSHLTAITRTKVNAPMKWLHENGLLPRGKMLDYGCGKGFSADQLGMDKYDPFYYPDEPNEQYDVITCNYVLNVLEEIDQIWVLKNITNHLKPNGVAYIAVRKDVKVDGYTKKGTYQCDVNLNLPKVHHKSNRFTIYELRGKDVKQL